MKQVELIYDRDCPNVGPARAVLLKAFQALSMEPQWVEWDRSDPDSPPEIQACGSPTILVSGLDVAGNTEDSSGGACRLYRDEEGRFSGVPSVGSVVEALRRSPSDEQAIVATGQRSRWTSLATLPAMGAALIPAGICPACWPAYLGFLGSIGAGALVETRNLFLLTALLLAVSLASLGYRAPRRRGYGPLALGSAAVILILGAKFVATSDGGVVAGVLMLLAASVWNAWPKRRRALANAPCPDCREDAITPIRKNLLKESS